MIYTVYYNSPLGRILLAADENGLVGLWFEGQKYFARTLNKEKCEGKTKILSDTEKWLDIYFSGKEPNFTPPLNPCGTPFQKAVWEVLLKVPYGKTITYGEIARRLEESGKTVRASAQAVGGAVGHNTVSIIIPCHRVVGKDGSLTGYAGGIDKKISLLKIEGVDIGTFFVPKNTTAP